ncbi:S9 family peptidase [Arenibacter sp. ARW7G5Y1]|uniref:alpha/beta hydrolase family protein n=1 Tax=Arenibacter sp. ARW7G5Y1 TaxID=2135619 RepID=UPI000D752460|nr:acetylxylan esterase [Arenibacter sp. ARW7G5Y1]PXX26516.1 acetyl xylan esterase AXE1 [Arenibacter sp. ARW7G5Y1]
MFKMIKPKALTLGIILIFLLNPSNAWSQTNYSVLDFWKYYSDAENQLYKQQAEISFQSLAKRKESISKLHTKTDWEGRQGWVKGRLQESIGDFPERTPLNPIITKRIKKDGYSVEKLYFESIPGVKVTAAFFIPHGKRKNLPTIIYCSGHSDLAFRSDIYQHVILNLVKKGFAVFAFDPYGQGERLQYFDQHLGKSRFSPTREHSYPGAQLFINGSSTAKYMIWDGIRAVDYLLTRKEVDPERIGITGRSGGGTQSSHIAAFDGRIKASAPECYITTMEYQLKSGGPQDAEQNFPKGIQLGLDHADLLQVRAPKPTLMITTTRDIFSIQGARDTYEETKRAYKALGKEGNLLMVEDNAGHQSTLNNREAMYAFFQKHLDNPGNSKDEEVVIFPVEELYVTETGQLSTSVGSKFLFHLNSDRTKKNLVLLNEGRQNLNQHLINLKQKVKAISGYTETAKKAKLIFSGQTEFEAYFLNKYLIKEEGDKIIPFITFVPKHPMGGSVLYLDNMKDKESSEAYAIPIQMAQKGVTVIVPDLPGYGELGPGYLKGDAYFENTSYNQWFAGILNGKSTVAIHVEAIETLLQVCKTDLKLDDKEIMGISKGGFNSSLLHAAVLGVDFKGMLFLDPLLSFQSVVSDKNYNPAHMPFTVAGALPNYDLQDLSAAFAPKKLKIITESDTLAAEQFKKSCEFVAKRYESMDEANNFSITKINAAREAMNLINAFISDF